MQHIISLDLHRVQKLLIFLIELLFYIIVIIPLCTLDEISLQGLSTSHGCSQKKNYTANYELECCSSSLFTKKLLFSLLLIHIV